MIQSDLLTFTEKKCFKNAILQKIQAWSYNFFYSNWFFALMAIVMVLSWKLEIVELAFVFVILVSTITWFFMDDISPFIACFFCIPYIFPLDIHVENYYHIIPLLIPVVAGIIFHIFYYSSKKFVKGRYLFPQLAVTIALIMGGLGSNALPSEYAHGLGQIVQLGPLLLLIYMACANYMTVRGEDQTIYFSKMLITTSVILVVETFIFVISNYSTYIQDTYINLGIVNSNGAATIIMMCLPFSFYMILKRPRWTILLYIFILLQYVAVILTFSRGGILFSLITLPMNLIFLICKSDHKKQLGLLTALALGIIIVFAIIFRDKIVDVFNSIMDSIHNISGDEPMEARFTLWKDGWNQFVKYPAFGVGIGYIGVGYTPGLSGTFWFHSTIIQVIACTGIFGVFMYLYNYVVRFRIVGKGIKRNPFKAFVLFAMIGFEGYSIINNGTFLAIPAMLMITVMTFMCERSDSYLDYLDGKI